MWSRWNVFGSALTTASNRPDRWTLRCTSSGRAADSEDLQAVERGAGALSQAVTGLHTR